MMHRDSDAIKWSSLMTTAARVDRTHAVFYWLALTPLLK
jgi:hypothetical protein